MSQCKHLPVNNDQVQRPKEDLSGCGRWGLTEEDHCVEPKEVLPGCGRRGLEEVENEGKEDMTSNKTSQEDLFEKLKEED